MISLELQYVRGVFTGCGEKMEKNKQTYTYSYIQVNVLCNELVYRLRLYGMKLQGKL